MPLDKGRVAVSQAGRHFAPGGGTVLALREPVGCPGRRGRRTPLLRQPAPQHDHGRISKPPHRHARKRRGRLRLPFCRRQATIDRAFREVARTADGRGRHRPCSPVTPRRSPRSSSPAASDCGTISPATGPATRATRCQAGRVSGPTFIGRTAISASSCASCNRIFRRSSRSICRRFLTKSSGKNMGLFSSPAAQAAARRRPSPRF